MAADVDGAGMDAKRLMSVAQAADTLVRDTDTGGVQLPVMQTNNATVDTAQVWQQLAMGGLRAVEHGRPAFMASPVGICAVVATEGTLRDATRFNKAAVIVREMHLPQRTTIATGLGAVPGSSWVSPHSWRPRWRWCCPGVLGRW